MGPTDPAARRRGGLCSAPDRSIRTAVATEFGEALARLIEQVPGARGAVLGDARGDPIDFAWWSPDVAEIDVELAGAQVGVLMFDFDATARIHGLGRGIVLLEGTRGALASAVVAEHYLLTLLLGWPANLARALQQLQHTRAELVPLLV
jgi:hypothetical protein